MTHPEPRAGAAPRAGRLPSSLRAAGLRLGALALAGALLAACSSSGPGSSAPASSAAGSSTATSPASTALITIRNFAFHPATLTVRKGTLVKVVNDDQVAHTVTALDHSFDTGDISGGGGTATFRAQATGTFPYMCTIHPFMHGTLTVVA
ncbi:MAG TPA: cupredoxin domain-containing protein [Acidimicrobiales bacterium]|nr:cupredoxin domain-containing protein [Acidimicrobiales bacterium]